MSSSEGMNTPAGESCGGRSGNSTRTSSRPSSVVPSTQKLKGKTVETMLNPFDAAWAMYGDAYASNPQHHRILNMLHSLVPPRSEILDVGCGNGKPTAHFLASHGHKVTGIDLSPSMISLCDSNVKFTASFQIDDMREFVPKGPFDAVCAFYALFQLPLREVKAQMYRMSAWLRARGLLAMSTVPYDSFAPSSTSRGDAEFNGVSEDETGDEVDSSVNIKWMGFECHWTMLTARQWEELLDKVGLDIVVQEWFDFKPREVGNACGSLTMEKQMWIIARKRMKAEPLLDCCWVADVPELYAPVERAFARSHLYAGAKFADRINWSLITGTAEQNAILGGGFEHIAESTPFTTAFVDPDSLICLYSFPEKCEELLDLISVNPTLSTITVVHHAPYNEAVNVLRDLHYNYNLSFPSPQGDILRAAQQELENHGFVAVSIHAAELLMGWSEFNMERAVAQAAYELVQWMWPDLGLDQRLDIVGDVQDILRGFWGEPNANRSPERNLGFPATVIRMERAKSDLNYR